MPASISGPWKVLEILLECKGSARSRLHLSGSRYILHQLTGLKPLKTFLPLFRFVGRRRPAQQPPDPCSTAFNSEYQVSRRQNQHHNHQKGGHHPHNPQHLTVKGAVEGAGGSRSKTGVGGGIVVRGAGNNGLGPTFNLSATTKCDISTDITTESEFVTTAGGGSGGGGGGTDDW